MKANKGFTLIELIVAILLLIIAIGAAYLYFYLPTNSNKNGSDNTPTTKTISPTVSPTKALDEDWPLFEYSIFGSDFSFKYPPNLHVTLKSAEGGSSFAVPGSDYTALWLTYLSKNRTEDPASWSDYSDKIALSELYGQGLKIEQSLEVSVGQDKGYIRVIKKADGKTYYVGIVRDQLESNNVDEFGYLFHVEDINSVSIQDLQMIMSSFTFKSK